MVLCFLSFGCSFFNVVVVLEDICIVWLGMILEMGDVVVGVGCKNVVERMLVE